jgi:F0F1-type ATP synthase membrane subunit b/b'
VTKAADEKLANLQKQAKSLREDLTERAEQIAPRREKPS